MEQRHTLTRNLDVSLSGFRVCRFVVNNQMGVNTLLSYILMRLLTNSSCSCLVICPIIFIGCHTLWVFSSGVMDIFLFLKIWNFILGYGKVTWKKFDFFKCYFLWFIRQAQSSAQSRTNCSPLLSLDLPEYWSLVFNGFMSFFSLATGNRYYSWLCARQIPFTPSSPDDSLPCLG